MNNNLDDTKAFLPAKEYPSSAIGGSMEERDHILAEMDRLGEALKKAEAKRDRLRRLLVDSDSKKQRLLDFVISWIERVGDGPKTGGWIDEFLQEAAVLAGFDGFKAAK